MSEPSTSAESRLTRLLERLLTAAEASLAAGDLEQARATAEEVRAVDPDNRRSAHILQRLAARQHGPTGERALMTLLFSDLVGSTLLSEQVEPEQLRDLFTVYRAAARQAVKRYNGSLLQFPGDGILAGFGYPEPHEDDARRAVLAGLDLAVAMRDAQADLERRLGLSADIRVGIHTGRVVVSHLGDDVSAAERDSIVGITPNLTARIQQAAEPGMVVISDVTEQLVDADFFMHSMGEYELKGVSRRVEVFAVERPRYAAARFEVERYRKAGLVGRDEPRDRLLAAWQAIGDSQAPAPGATFLLVGEPGIGKSRLVAELLDRVEASGGAVLGAGCLPYYANVSLWPIARMLERVLGWSGEDPAGSQHLGAHLDSLDLDPARYVPFLGPLIGGSQDGDYPAPELDPSAFLEESLGRLVEWLSALSARRRPHLLVVEDLHWADPSTIALLARLAAAPPDSILTVATTRDSTAIPWRDAAVQLELGRLDAKEASRLVDNLSTGTVLNEDQRSSIIEQSEGIPLFIEEMTRSCVSDRRTEPMPLRLQELFTWRLKQPEVDLRVVQVAATVGPTFDAPLVSAVVGDEAIVTDQVPILVEEGVIEPVGPSAGGRYRFRHALMRDAAYETQVLDVRRQTHATIAEVMSRQGAEPALIAAHLDLAGMGQRAAALYVSAAQAEQRRGAHIEATRLLTRALELLDTFPESEERDVSELTARMLRGLSVTATQGYAAPEVQFDHRRAEVLATRLGTQPEVLLSLIAIWAYWLVSGNLATARGLTDRLQAMVRQPAFSWFEPEVEVCAGWLEFFAGNLDTAWEHLGRGMEGFLARPEDEAVSPFWPLPHDPLSVSQIAMSCICTLRGDPGGARHWEREAAERVERVGFPRGPFSAAFIQTFVAWIRRFVGDDEAAWRAGAEVVAIGREHGYAFWTVVGSAYSLTGTPGSQTHRDSVEGAVGRLRLIGQESFSAAHLGYLGRLYADVGEPDRALEFVAQAVDAVHKTGEGIHLPALLRQRAKYTLALGGDVGDAVADLAQAVRTATEQDARVDRLRTALDIASLPDDHRPADWHHTLSAARAAVLPALVTADTVAADEILAT